VLPVVEALLAEEHPGAEEALSGLVVVRREVDLEEDSQVDEEAAQEAVGLPREVVAGDIDNITCVLEAVFISQHGLAHRWAGYPYGE
jgi:hypothetical protein